MTTNDDDDTNNKLNNNNSWIERMFTLPLRWAQASPLTLARKSRYDITMKACTIVSSLLQTDEVASSGPMNRGARADFALH